MKKKTIFASLLAAFLLCFAYSCMQEQVDELDNESFYERSKPLIMDAMRKYDSYFPEEGIMELRSWKDAGGIAVKPLWQYANVYGDKDYHAAEFLLDSEKGFDYATPESADKFKKTRDRRYRTSQTNFVYLVEKKTGREIMFLMTLVPDLSYIESTKFKPFDKMSYLKRDKKYSGYIFFHNMEGRYVNGWRYSSGEITHTVTANEEEADFDIVSTRSLVCTTHYLVWYVEECKFWGNASGENWGWDCTSWYEYQPLYTSCIDDGTGDGNYNSGGGSSGDGGSGNSGGTFNGLALNCSLNSEGVQLLYDKIEEMKQECIYNYMFNTISGNKQFTIITTNPGMSTYGGYNPNTGVLFFQNNSEIPSAFPEEFFHLYQDWRYEGISQYLNTTGHPNIEFEVKVLHDLMNYMNCSFWGAPFGSPLESEYSNWLLQLIDKTPLTYNDIMTHKYNGYGYFDFLWSFRQSHPSGNYPINSGLFPALLQDVFSNSGCS